MIIKEISEHFFRALFEDGIPSKYNIKHAIFGSQDQGWPIRRCRFYGYCLNQQHLVWVGPSKQTVLQNFLRWSGRICILEGDSFVGLDISSARDIYFKKQMAMKRGMHPIEE